MTFMPGLLYEYSTPICRQHPHICQAGLFVLLLSLRANKPHAAVEKRTENCQHRRFFEEEQMIKSVRFNNKLTVPVLFLSPSLPVDGGKGRENSAYQQLSACLSGKAEDLRNIW